MAATQFEIDCAIMAGKAYISNRPYEINRFPIPRNWALIDDSHVLMPSGFEAVSFTDGNQIVISFAGTDDECWSGKTGQRHK